MRAKQISCSLASSAGEVPSSIRQTMEQVRSYLTSTGLWCRSSHETRGKWRREHNRAWWGRAMGGEKQDEAGQRKVQTPCSHHRESHTVF
jgi:hypothetical protein